MRNREQHSDHIYYTLLWQVLGLAVHFTSLSKLCCAQTILLSQTVQFCLFYIQFRFAGSHTEHRWSCSYWQPMEEAQLGGVGGDSLSSPWCSITFCCMESSLANPLLDHESLLRQEEKKNTIHPMLFLFLLVSWLCSFVPYTLHIPKWLCAAKCTSPHSL